MDRDEPIAAILQKVRDLSATSDIVLLTGRPENYREHTVAWLTKHDVPYTQLLMRRAGDHRPDYTAKEDLLRELPRERISLAIDDRAPVCEMYRRNGLEVLEVAGDEQGEIANNEVNDAYRRHPE
jgi:hypothetical protein